MMTWGWTCSVKSSIRINMNLYHEMKHCHNVSHSAPVPFVRDLCRGPSTLYILSVVRTILPV